MPPDEAGACAACARSDRVAQLLIVLDRALAALPADVGDARRHLVEADHVLEACRRDAAATAARLVGLFGAEADRAIRVQRGVLDVIAQDLENMREALRTLPQSVTH